jgi:tetratricopeptide (TPR) repeat protein
LEKISDQQTRSESKTRHVEQFNICLRSGDYSRALDLLRGAAAEFPDDVELSELEKVAQDGIERKAEADRLITESQELFAQRKPAEAIQLLRKAYELDKRNSLARAILANALVEHAHSLVETDWLEAETLTNQALNLNPAHPTANTIRNLIVEQKQNSSIEDWVARASKLQSSGDLFAALAWVAEGLAVHPDDPKLLQIQDSIQRDQGVRRRQTRRGDLDNLRRMELEIDAGADDAVKQALAGRIQGMAAKYWTDGEMLSIANRLLHQLGMAPKASAGAPRGKGAALIFHVPRPSAPEPSRANTTAAPATQAAPRPPATSEIPPSTVTPESVAPAAAPASKVATAPEPEVIRARAATVPATEASSDKPSAPATKVASPSSKPKQPTRSSSTTLIFITAAAIILVAAIFFFAFFARKHPAQPVANTPSAAPLASKPPVSAPSDSAPAVTAPEQTKSEPAISKEAAPAVDASTDTAAKKPAVNDQPPPGPVQNADSGQSPEPGKNLGTLLIVAGQDNASVFLNGKLQRQATQGGQLRLPNLELNEYVVQVTKSGFQDPPAQKIRVRKGEQALIFNLQPQPHLASLTIQGGAPDTAVMVDQTLVGTIQPDGTLSVSTVNPGDHTIELRKERFKPRQLKKHFVAGGTISLAAADAALEAALSELKITFVPADANVAITKGDQLKIVSSGVPLSLAPGTYTLTARTAERFTRSSTLEITAGQSKTLDLSLAPSGMSKWDDAGAWKQEKDSFLRKGGDFVLYGVAPASGTFAFSAMPAKGHVLQWVLNYSDPKNYVLFQIDDKNFYRTVIRRGEKTDEIIVPDRDDKKSIRTIQIRVSPTEVVHQIKHGDRWTVLDRWTQPGTNLSLGKFGFYIPGNDEVALSSFAHYADLNIR